MPIQTTFSQDNKRMAAGNRRLAQWRVTCLIEHSTSHQLLWCIDSFVLQNPPLRQAPTRYRQAKKTTVRRLLAVICAKFAEKVLFAENK